MTQAQIFTEFKKAGIQVYNDSKDELHEEKDKKDTHLEDIQDKGFYDRTFVAKNISKQRRNTPKRTLLIDQGDIFAYRQLQREILKNSSNDTEEKRISTQVWYDSLRGTDDGNYVKIVEEDDYNPIIIKDDPELM